MDFEPGQILGDYEILRVLGTGGMGKVFQVRNNLSQRVEAMKVLLPDLTSDSELADRFLREIRISASLDHPNIAALRTAQRLNNQLIMVMEHVEGATFDSLLAKSRIPAGKAVNYALQSLSALTYAHSRGVVHRDVKPGNIMLTPSGSVKLMDFGIATVATDSKLTKTGLMVGSAYYMSPEQIEGRELGPLSDIYSLGITLYEICTGQRPFHGSSEYQIMAAHLKEIPQPPRDLDHSLPAELNDIILKAMAKEPERRFQSAEAFRAALLSVESSVAVSSLAVSSLDRGPATKTMPEASEPRSVPPSASVPPPVQVQPVVKPDRRLLYMAAGSLATIAAIAAGITEIPKYRHANAAPQSSPAKQEPMPSAQPAVVPAPVEPPRSVPVARASEQREPQARPSEVAKVSAPAIPATSSPSAVQAPDPAAAQLDKPLSIPPAAPVAIDEELSGLHDRMINLAARVTAVTASLQRLQDQQARQGLGLRSDMVAAQQRLNSQMGEADSNLRQSNAAGARKRLDLTERDLEKLESVLGR